jgi:hypothetical protein
VHLNWAANHALLTIVFIHPPKLDTMALFSKHSFSFSLACF